MTLIVNYFGGPCAGKSTMAGGIFNKLKSVGYDVEYVQEFAKTLTWEKNYEGLKHQSYVTGVQMYTQNMLLNQVQVVITDSPILIGLMYYNESSPKIKWAFETFVIESFKAQNNINFFIKRNDYYTNVGRRRTKEEAIKIDERIQQLFQENNIQYHTIDANNDGLEVSLKLVLETLNKEI